MKNGAACVFLSFAPRFVSFQTREALRIEYVRALQTLGGGASIRCKGVSRVPPSAGCKVGVARVTLRLAELG